MARNISAEQSQIGWQRRGKRGAICVFHLGSIPAVWRQLSCFWREERGVVLIYVTLILPVLVGLAVIAVDVARAYNLRIELQKAADALALAAAAELDGNPRARTRAGNAISAMLQNQQYFAQGGPTPGYSFDFLKLLPADDATDLLPLLMHADYRAESDAESRYVFVRVFPGTPSSPGSLLALLPVAFIGSSSSSLATHATAVAGFTAVVCKTMPMFICNPFEGTGTSIFSQSALGKQIKMQTQGGNTSQYFPGNYGWLDTPDFQDPGVSGQGAGNLRNALASVRPPVCFNQNGVTVRTGNIENANDAINVRFDLWLGPFNNQKNNANYRPAQNVRKGYKPGAGTNGACNPDDRPTEPNPNYGRLPRDSSFPDSSGRLGNGNWDFDAYWAANYAGISKPLDANGVEWSNSNLPSRYQVYLHELSTMGSAEDLVAHISPAPYSESGRPLCYSGGGLSAEPDRRLLYAAIINCNEVNINGNSAERLPVLAFGKFFITEPVPNPPDPEAGTIYSEFVEAIGPGNVDKSVARDQVQLYR